MSSLVQMKQIIFLRNDEGGIETIPSNLSKYPKRKWRLFANEDRLGNIVFEETIR